MCITNHQSILLLHVTGCSCVYHLVSHVTSQPRQSVYLKRALTCGDRHTTSQWSLLRSPCMYESPIDCCTVSYCYCLIEILIFYSDVSHSICFSIHGSLGMLNTIKPQLLQYKIQITHTSISHLGSLEQMSTSFILLIIVL